MFEDCFARSPKETRPSSDRAVGLVATLLVHALLAFVVYHGRFTVKVLPFKKGEVRSVMIVPPLKLTIPKVVGGRDFVSEPLAPTERAGPAGQGTQPGEPGPHSAEPPPGPAGTRPAVGAAAPEASRPPPGAGSAIPSLSSRFRQSLAGRSRGPGEEGLSIALAPPGALPGPPGVGGRAPLPDFSKYGRGVPGGRGGSGGGSGRAGGFGGRQRVGVSIPLKGYDLVPWASVVVDRIQRFWQLPAVPGGPPANARIRMAVVIKKSGELDSIEILEGTSVDVLDLAALEAVRAGLPFPALPADFPGDLLEILFEFVYND